jgi:ATP-dependent Clp endopeptidase proteolytic subunit ClpP
MYRSITRHNYHTHNKKRKLINENADEEMMNLKNAVCSRMEDIFVKNDDYQKCKENHIYFDENVTHNSCRQLICDIEQLNIKLGKLECDYDIDGQMKIYIHINSLGGSIFSALGVIDAMRQSKYPIVTIVEGAVASAATLISVYGNERWMTLNSYMLIHQLSSECWGKMSEIEDEYNNLNVLTEHINKIYIERTHITKAKLRHILKHDRWWNAEQCITYGLIDKIV